MNGRKAWMAGLVVCLSFLSGCTRERNGEVAARISLEYSTHRQLTEMRVQGRDAVKEYLRNNPEVCDKIEQEIRANSFKLMSPQARKAAQVSGRAVDITASDFDEG